MKRLAFIMLLSTFLIGATFSQPYVADLNYVDPPEEYFLGCGLIEFEWSIKGGFGSRDAQIHYILWFYEIESIQWDESSEYGIPDPVFETYWDATLQRTIQRINIDDYFEDNGQGQTKPALGRVFLRPIEQNYGASNRITHRAKPSSSTTWWDYKEFDPSTTGEILSGKVSDLIPSKLLSQSNACSANREYAYYIESELIVDVDYCFRALLGSPNREWNIIGLAPGANIIVNEGIKLKLDRILVTSCQGTWGSIILKEGASLEVNKSKIQNATLAIDQEGGTDVNIIDSDIEACESGIRSIGGRTLYVKNSTITNSAASGRGKIAVELKDHKNASITESHIEHFEEGIIGRNTNVQCTKSSIHDMDGTGIDLEGSGYGDFSKIIGDRNSGSGRVNFKDCSTGVKVVRQRVHIEGNVMTDLDVGISMSNTFNDEQRFLDNDIKARDYGIILNQNSGIRGKIADNEIRIIAGGQFAQASCIRMDNTGPGWQIKQNSFYIDEGTYGVRSSYNRLFSISDNYFEVPNDKLAFGVYAGDELFFRLQCNTAFSTLSSSETTGFYLKGASNYFATCNTTSGVQKGFYFNGQNTGMNNLRGNNLGGVYGLAIGDEGSRCDMQFNRGNCFDNSSASMLENTFEAGRNSQIRYNDDPQNGGSACFEPDNIYGPDNWFIEDTEIEYDCASIYAPCDAPAGPPSTGVCDSESYIHTIDSPRVWTYNQEAQQMYAELAIYHTLRLANCTSPAPTLDSLLTTHQDDVWDAYASYEEAMAEISEFQLAHDSVILVNQWDRMAWFDSLGTLFADTSYYDSSAVQSVLGHIAQCDSVIQSRELIIATDVINFIGSMHSILNAVTPSNLHETRLINVLKIHLDVYREDSTIIDLSTSDSLYLDSMAMLCIYESGKAGAIARTLLSYFRPAEQYDDDTLCVPIQYLVRPGTDSITEMKQALVPQTIDAPSEIRVSPNPTTGDWHIEFLNGDQGQIKVMDLRGRVVADMRVTGLSVRVPATGLPSGMYLLQWTDSGGHVEVHKLFVQ